DPAADDAFRQRQRLDDELHGERRRVPPAGDQFLEERRARDRLAQVPRLRIELAAKSLDRIGVDDGARVRGEHLPRSEVLEISLVHRILLREAARRGMANRPRMARSPGPALRGRSAINGGLFSPASVRCKCALRSRIDGNLRGGIRMATSSVCSLSRLRGRGGGGGVPYTESHLSEMLV